jgi:hypothetical protein
MATFERISFPLIDLYSMPGNARQSQGGRTIATLASNDTKKMLLGSELVVFFLC